MYDGILELSEFCFLRVKVRTSSDLELKHLPLVSKLPPLLGVLLYGPLWPFFLSVYHASIIGDEGKRQRLEKLPPVTNSSGRKLQKVRMRHEIVPVGECEKRRSREC